jgi:integrase
VLESVNVPYRKPYTTRSTLISHWLEAGENPVVVAEFTGHDVATLYKHYAGSIRKRATPPDFLSLDPSPPTT